MSYWRASLVVPLLLVAVGCSTNPRKGASVVYRLPKTQVRVVLAVDVTECSPNLVLDSTLTLNAVALPGDELYKIEGAELASSVTKRGVTIDVDDRGVISSVNAAVTDQKAVILGNVIKLAATAVAAAPLGYVGGAGSRWKLSCSRKAEEYLDNAGKTERLIDQIRRSAPSAASAEIRQKQIDALASQLAALKANLHKEVIATADLSTTSADNRPLKFEFKPLDSLLTTSVVQADKSEVQVEGVSGASAGLFSADLASIHVEPHDALSESAHHDLRKCTLSMKVPSQDRFKITVSPTGGLVTPEHPGDEVQAVVPASMAAGEQLCLSAVFGENRTVGLKFDKFGQVQQLAWSSDASAANVTSAAAGAMPDATGLIKSLHDRDLAADKAELDRLTTEQSLRKARACQAALEAGATTCP